MTHSFQPSRLASYTAYALTATLMFTVPQRIYTQAGAPDARPVSAGLDGDDTSKGKGKKVGQDACVEGPGKGKDKADKDKGNGNAKGHKDECSQGSSSGIARGDFNGDGIGDLAIGVPFEDLGTAEDAGAVNVIYGSAAGLSATAGPGDQLLSVDAESGDRFGSALASGEFNGDSFSDLAVGAPGEDKSGKANSGAVTIFYGSAAGLTYGGIDFAAPGNPPGQEFGAALAWGDFDGDHFGDLAVGVPRLGSEGATQAGAVYILNGSPGGLTVAGYQIWDQNSPGIADTAEAGDRFGATLAGGDFNADTISDLAVGVPFEAIATNEDAGAVHVIYGSPAGLSATAGPGNQFWSQDTTGIMDQAEPGERFGAALAAIGSNGSDLAIGVPLESAGTVLDAGAVHVIYGGAAGLSANRNQRWLDRDPESGDAFGSALAGGDFDGNGLRDLAIGVPGEDVGDIRDAGQVSIISYDTLTTGLTVTAGLGHQIFNQNSAGIEGSAEAGDRFGSSLTAWNFGKGSLADLAIGVPSEDVSGAAGAGAVNVIYGGAPTFPAGLRAADDQVWTQDSPEIEGTAEAGDQFGRSMY